jgi:hypothetical protein
VALTGASTACDKGLPEGLKHRSMAEALGLAYQSVKPACHLLSAVALAMGSKSASISHEEVGSGQRFRPRIFLERGAVALRAVPVPGTQRRINCVPEEPKMVVAHRAFAKDLLAFRQGRATLDRILGHDRKLSEDPRAHETEPGLAADRQGTVQQGEPLVLAGSPLN